MGTDYRLLANDAYLDLQGWGQKVFNLVGSTATPDAPVRMIEGHLAGVGREGFWKGVRRFIRDQGPCLVISEHNEAWDQCQGKAAYSVYSKRGNYKRLGYGPL